MWGQKRLKGQVYDLSHLDQFILHVTPKAAGAPTYSVGVSFSCHVFTEIWDDDIHTPDLRFVDGDEVRCFSTERHELSKRLPALIEFVSTRKTYFSDGDNFVMHENVDGLAGPYAAFFKIAKARTGNVDARMFVVSAYEKPALPTRLKAITFATLVSKTARGEPITRPKK